jgi:hypothetical protein
MAGSRILLSATAEGREITPSDGKRYAREAAEIAGPEKAIQILIKDRIDGALNRGKGDIYEKAFHLTVHALDTFEPQLRGKVNLAGALIIAKAVAEGRDVTPADGKRYVQEAIQIAGPDKAFDILLKDEQDSERTRHQGNSHNQAYLLAKHAVDSLVRDGVDSFQSP